MTNRETEDMTDDKPTDEPHLSGPKQCTCEWRTIDGGAIFHDVRIPAKDCPVHGNK